MTAPLPIGALRHRLVLERATTDADGATVWTGTDVVFAAITSLGEGETTAAGPPTGLARRRIEMRYRDDLSSRDRLRLGERIFRILATRDLDERRNRLVVVAEEDGR
jgi:SPP1 family predicted phage head-tail adaptor